MAGDARADVMKQIGSSKNLWILLTASSLTSKDLVGTELQTNLKKICSGLNFFLLRTPESVKKFQNDSSVNTRLSKMIIQMSKFMNLDEYQCYELFCDFLLYEYRGSDAALQNVIGNERQMEVLMIQMWEYYRSERLFLLLCIKEIVCHYDDLSHPYYDLFDEFMTLVDDNSELQFSLFSQWENLLKIIIPSSKMQSSFLIDKQAQTWLMYTLREQCEILQIMLLYYNGKSCSLEMFSNLLTSFKEHGFGWWQLNSHLLDESSNGVLQSIGCLECLILLKALNLDTLETHEVQTYFLFLEKPKWEKLDSIVCHFGSQREHGPLLLAWSIIHYHLMKDEGYSVCQSLGNSALQCGVFTFLLSVLQNHTFPEVVTSCIRSVIYSLLSSLLTQFDAVSLGDTSSLYKITEILLCDKILSEKFWSQGLNSGFGVLLSSAMEKFPLSFCPTVDCLAALSAASPSSASSVIALFSQMPHFTLPLSPQMNFRELWNEESHPLELLENYYPFPTDTICLYSGTVGYPLTDLNEQEDVIQWRQPVNGWQIGLVIASEILQPAGVTSDMPKNKVQQMRSLIILICNLLRNSEISSRLGHLLDEIYLVIQRFAEMQQPPVNVIAASLDLAASVRSEDEMMLMWERLKRTGILPLSAGGISTVVDRYVDFSCGAINSIIASCECVTGDYSLTLAFLNLISSYVMVLMDRDDEYFVPCVIFVAREIFPSYLRWWYHHAEQKEQVAQKCLSIFHRILRMPFDDCTLSNAKNKSGLLQKMVVDCVLQEEAGPALLQIICTGEETIHQTLEHQISWISGQGLELLQVIKLALSVLNRLLILWRYAKKAQSPLVVTLCSDPVAIRTVANYVYHRFDTRLATLGILLMKRFARELPISLLVCLGPEAPAFCKLLLLRLEARAEDTRLKSAILNFLSICVAYQPGTTEAVIGDVLDNASDDKLLQQETNGPTSRCLKLVVDLLYLYKQQDHGCCEELHSSILFFLKSLWIGRQTLALNDLKTCSNFWNILLDPLMHNFVSSPFRSSEFTLAILSQEFLFPKPKTGGNQLSSLLLKLTSGSAIVDWMVSLYDKCASVGANADTTSKDSSLLTSFTESSVSESQGLLNALKDFLIIGVKTGWLEISQMQKAVIIKNTINTLVNRLSKDTNRNCLVILSEILLYLLYSWNDYELDCNTRMTQLQHLLNPVLNSGDTIPTKVVANVVASCLVIVPAASEKSISTLLDDETISSIMEIVCTITHRSILVDDKTLVDGTSTKIRLIVLCVNLLQKLSWTFCNSDLWRAHLQRSSVVHSLLNFALRCLQLRKAPDACYDILCVLGRLSQFPKICDALLSANVIQILCLPLSELVSNPPENALSSTTNSEGLSQVKWSDVYHSAIRLIAQILHRQQHFVVEAVLDFASVHLQLFQQIPLQLHNSLSSETLDLALAVLQLIHELSHFQALWRLHAVNLLKELLQMTSGVCYVAVAFLLRPRFILHSIEEGKETKMMPKLVKDDDQNLLKRMSSTEEMEKLSPKLLTVSTKLLRLVLLCISTLNNFSPDVSELLSEQGYDTNQWEQLLEISFGSPSLDQITPTSFGTIISSATICLRIVIGGDRASSPAQVSPLEVSHPNRQLVMCLLEKSLYLILSQATLILSNVRQPLWDQQLFKRELGAELSSFVQSRYLKRGSAASPISTASVVSPGQSRSRLPVEKQPFLNLVSALVDNFFK